MQILTPPIAAFRQICRAQHVADLLERIPLRQCHLLEWYAQGYDDTQVAAWLRTSPQAVREQAWRLRALRAQNHLPETSDCHPSHPPQRKNFLDPT